MFCGRTWDTIRKMRTYLGRTWTYVDVRGTYLGRTWDVPGTYLRHHTKSGHHTVKGLKSRLRASKEQRRAEQVERKNVQEAATVMALNLATSIIERAGLGRDIPIPDAP